MNGKLLHTPATKITVVAVSGLIMLGYVAISSENEPEPRPLPFDPLSAVEQEKAMALLLDDPDVQRSLSDRVEPIGAALHTDKAFRDLEVWPRMAEVWLYDYANNRAVRGLVDLGEEGVTLWDHPPVQPPATTNEVYRSGLLALEDGGVQKRLTGEGIDPAEAHWTARLWSGPGVTDCPQHRCLLVSFTDGHGHFTGDFTVLADLTDDRVVAILGINGMPEETETLGALL